VVERYTFHASMLQEYIRSAKCCIPFTTEGLLCAVGGLHNVTMFSSIFRVLPSRVSEFLTASYFTGGLESDDHA
jgi:hypothetical protein